MARPVIAQRVARIAEDASARLDGMSDLLPEMRPPRLDLATYIQRATQAAQRDPQFRAEFESALRQWRAAQTIGGQHGLEQSP